MKKRIHRERSVWTEQKHNAADYGANRQKRIPATLDKAYSEHTHKTAV